jgi:hypothetical protein
VQQPPAPIIVKIVERPHDPTGLADVLLGAIGVAGVITLIAIVCGLVFAGALFLIRRWRSA